MNRINLSQDEKKVLKMLRINKRIISPPQELRAAIYELVRKQFVIIADTKNGIATVWLSDRGQAYINQYPRLCNPVPSWIKSIGNLVTNLLLKV